MSKRFFSGGAAKPSWAVPQHQRFGPTLPDNAYYGEHATYNYFVLFVRGLRPYLEKIFGDCATTIREVALGVYCPVKATVLKHNPEFRLVSGNSPLSLRLVFFGRFASAFSRKKEKHLLAFPSDVRQERGLSFFPNVACALLVLLHYTSRFFDRGIHAGLGIVECEFLRLRGRGPERVFNKSAAGARLCFSGRERSCAVALI